jgi:hypothetical protein
MSSGFGSPAVAPGSHFSNWDSASRRRFSVSQKAPRPSWDVPSDYEHPARPNAQPASAAPAASTNDSSYVPNTTMDRSLAGTYSGGDGGIGDVAAAFRSSAMQDAAGKVAGARLTAMDASPDDPALAAYAQLEGQLGGQSQASQEVNNFNSQLLYGQQQQNWQKEMSQFDAEQYRKAHANDWMGELASVGGNIAGSWLSPGGLFKGKVRNNGGGKD